MRASAVGLVYALFAGCACEPPLGDANAPEASLLCGNGYLDSDEACDVVVPSETSCTAVGLGAGDVGCTSNCTLDLSGCCGDGTLGADEPCDGSDLRWTSCEALGYELGELSCTPDCELDDRGCTFVNEGSLLFDGIDDIVNCPAPPWQLIGSATWEAWILVPAGRPSSFHVSRKDPPPDDPLLGSGPSRGFAISSWFDPGTDGQFQCRFYGNDGGSASLPLDATADVWHHVACVIELVEAPFGTGLASSIKALLDDGSFVLPIGEPTQMFSAAATGDLFFGAHVADVGGTAPPGWGIFSGYLDEVRVWNYARSEEEIGRDLYRELRGDEPGLVAYYTFDEDGPWTVDSSSSSSPCMLGTAPDLDPGDPTWSSVTPFP